MKSLECIKLVVRSYKNMLNNNTFELQRKMISITIYIFTVKTYIVIMTTYFLFLKMLNMGVLLCKVDMILL